MWLPWHWTPSFLTTAWLPWLFFHNNAVFTLVTQWTVFRTGFTDEWQLMRINSRLMDWPKATGRTTKQLNLQNNQLAQLTEQPTGWTRYTTNRLNQQNNHLAEPAEQPIGSTSRTTNRLNQQNNQLAQPAEQPTSSTSTATNRLNQQPTQPARSQLVQPVQQPTSLTNRELSYSWCIVNSNCQSPVCLVKIHLYPSSTLPVNSINSTLSNKLNALLPNTNTTIWPDFCYRVFSVTRIP